jgi:hypothetical protein
MARTLSTQSLVSASRSVRMIGMPPPTEASNAMSTPFSIAVSTSAAPCFAINSLLAVTTLLPLRSARSMYVFAGSSPPIISTSTSTSLSENTVSASVVSHSRLHSGTRSLTGSRTNTCATSSGAPTRDAR